MPPSFDFQIVDNRLYAVDVARDRDCSIHGDLGRDDATQPDRAFECFNLDFGHVQWRLIQYFGLDLRRYDRVIHELAGAFRGCIPGAARNGRERDSEKQGANTGQKGLEGPHLGRSSRSLPGLASSGSLRL